MLTQRARWAETGHIALVQVVVSVLVGADVVLVARFGSGTAAEAGYQALSTLAKGPVYVAAGTVLVAFPLLRAGGPRGARGRADARAALVPALALTAAVVLATVPRSLVMLFLPEQYLGSRSCCRAGGRRARLRRVTVLATVLLALRMTRRTYVALAAATVLVAAGLGVGWALHGVNGMAAGAAIGALSATLVLAVLAAAALPRGTLARVPTSSSPPSLRSCCRSPRGSRCCGWRRGGRGLLALRPDVVRGLLRRRSRR